MNRGEYCEQIVLKDLKKRGYQIAIKNLKTPYAEIDIVLKHKKKPWLMVEVKSSNSMVFDSFRMSPRQKSRQENAHLFLEAKLNVDLQMVLAIVSKDLITYYSYDQL